MKTATIETPQRSRIEALQAENDELRRRLEEAEDTLLAIRTGGVDAIVVEESGSNRVYTLEGAEKPYRLFVEEIQQGAATLQGDGTIAWCNAQFAELLQVPQEKLLGTTLHQFVAGDRTQFDSLFWKGQTSGGRGESQLRRSDGTLLPVFLTFSALPKDCSAAMGLLVTDLTPQRHHEKLTAAHAALRESERRFREMIDALPAAIYTTDAEGRLTHFNPAAVEFSGRVPELGTDQWCVSFKLFQADGTPMAHSECPMAIALKEGRIIRGIEAIAERPDGTRVWFTPYPTPLRDGSGRVVGGINMLVDITVRKHVEIALREAQIALADRAVQLETLVAERTAELTASNAQLEAFVYSIAHDLRAPLRSMEGFSSILIDEAAATMSPAAMSYAKRINRSAQFMDGLLRDLLAFSRMSQEQIGLTPLDLDAVIRSVVLRLEPLIQQAGARVEFVSARSRAVLAHEPTLGQVLFNLLSNALKFVPANETPTARIVVEEMAADPCIPRTIHRGHANPVPVAVRVWVEDNGIGIAREHQDQIFRLFTRLNGEKYPGTGLGLAIVQKGIERMGGSLGLESTPGKGSRFWIQLQPASNGVPLSNGNGNGNGNGNDSGAVHRSGLKRAGSNGASAAKA